MCEPKNPYVRWDPYQSLEGARLSDTCRPIVIYLRANAFRIVSMPPLANVPARRNGDRMHSLPRAVTRRRCGFLPLVIIIVCSDDLDKPTRVLLGIYVNSFYSISEQTMVCL